MQKNGFIRKTRLISKFLTSRPGKQTTAIHILPNTSRSISNQEMKFDQFIEYNRTIFLKKSFTKCRGETIPRPFLRKQNCAYLWIKSLKFYAVFFCCMAIRGLSKYTEAVDHLLLPHIKRF